LSITLSWYLLLAKAAALRRRRKEFFALKIDFFLFKELSAA
jgi:hypothetical protein